MSDKWAGDTLITQELMCSIILYVAIVTMQNMYYVFVKNQVLK